MARTKFYIICNGKYAGLSYAAVIVAEWNDQKPLICSHWNLNEANITMYKIHDQSSSLTFEVTLLFFRLPYTRALEWSEKARVLHLLTPKCKDRMVRKIFVWRYLRAISFELIAFSQWKSEWNVNKRTVYCFLHSIIFFPFRLMVNVIGPFPLLAMALFISKQKTNDFF